MEVRDEAGAGKQRVGPEQGRVAASGKQGRQRKQKGSLAEGAGPGEHCAAYLTFLSGIAHERCCCQDLRDRGPWPGLDQAQRHRLPLPPRPQAQAGHCFPSHRISAETSQLVLTSATGE